MSWFLSDEIPEIPADILEKLENRFDRGDCFDVAEAEAERERSSVRRVIAINQQIHHRLIELQTDLITANTNMGYMREQVQDLVLKLRKSGSMPTHKPPSS